MTRQHAADTMGLLLLAATLTCTLGFTPLSYAPTSSWYKHHAGSAKARSSITNAHSLHLVADSITNNRHSSLLKLRMGAGDNNLMGDAETSAAHQKTLQLLLSRRSVLKAAAVGAAISSIPCPDSADADASGEQSSFVPKDQYTASTDSTFVRPPLKQCRGIRPPRCLASTFG